MRIGIFGRGRLGRAIAQEVEAAQDLVLAWQVDQGESPDGPVEVAIAASAADAVEGHLEWALDLGSDLVIGVTGWQLPNLPTHIGDRIGVLVAPNFSLSAALMARLSLVLGRFAALDAELDPYVLEHHHRAKTDAPSGTALRLAQAVMEGCPRKSAWTMGPTEPQELSVGVLRAGAEFGLHTVGLDAPAETLSLTHQARSRAVFAQGALRATRWIRGRKGLYSFDDLAQELLDPLFRFGGSR